MTTLLELKEYIKRFYGKYEVYVTPALKTIMALVMLMMINGSLGFMSRLNNFALVLIVALMCSFLPTGFMIVFGALYILGHMYALAMEAAIVVGCVFLILLLLYFSFSPKDALVVVLLPICFVLKIPYIIPIAVGLLLTPASIASVACGTVVYFIVHVVKESSTSIGSMEAAEIMARIRLVIDNLLNNKEMVVTVVAFSVTVIVVYIIRRLAIVKAWTIAAVAGGIVNAVVLLVGDLAADIDISIIGVILGTIVSVLLAKVVEFFAFNLDYSRTEKVQFEDDEYYYYVKAVPKITVSTPARTVKRINTRHSSGRGNSSRQRVEEYYPEEENYDYFGENEVEDYTDSDPR
ncbi:MAG: hypothetical protein J5537_05425 [Lachnospiraceae bacterium]|nr:hypothetical protein [Lachnospiraceae bacterium]